MPSLTPYTSAMRLGQGFNSYTREICIEDAVIFEPPVASVELPSQHTSAIRTAGPLKREITDSDVTSPKTADTPLSGQKTNAPTTLASPVTTSAPSPLTPSGSILPPPIPKNQTVVYTSQKIDHLSEILTALNISTYASIKYGTIEGGGSAGYVNEKKVNEADLNYVVSVKVTNESSRSSPIMRFNPIEGLDPSSFTEVFGDCFIADFLEGGEFHAVISVKTGSNSDTRSVQQALNLQLQTGIPGLSVGAKESIDKSKTDTLNDCEVTISVYWTGGGTIRSTTENWTIEEIVAVANAFPTRCAEHSTRTSAVVFEYNMLRSFQVAQATIPRKMIVLDYTACHVYSCDLFSAYMTYKALWEQITMMMKNSSDYQPLTLDTDGEKPIGTDPISLNMARIMCRVGMINILTEVESLRKHPEKAFMSDQSETVNIEPPKLANGTNGAGITASQKQAVLKFPALLAARLPRYAGSPVTLQDDLWQDGNWSADEMAVIMKFTSDRERLYFSPPVGDLPKRKGKPFCTLKETERNQSPPDLLQLAIHGHKHTLGEGVLHGDFSGWSSRFRGAVSLVGLTTSTTPAPRHPTPCKSAAHFGSAVSCAGNGYFAYADVSRVSITRVEVGYVPGSGCIASLKFFSRTGYPIVAWDMYSCKAAGWKEEERAKPVIKTVVPPAPESLDAMPDGGGSLDEDNIPKGSEWALAGFYGQADLVMQQIGLIWKRV